MNQLDFENIDGELKIEGLMMGYLLLVRLKARMTMVHTI